MDPNDPPKLVVTTSRPAPYTRRVAGYVPAQYVSGTATPIIVGGESSKRCRRALEWLWQRYPADRGKRPPP